MKFATSVFDIQFLFLPYQEKCWKNKIEIPLKWKFLSNVLIQSNQVYIIHILFFTFSLIENINYMESATLEKKCVAVKYIYIYRNELHEQVNIQSNCVIKHITIVE